MGRPSTTERARRLIALLGHLQPNTRVKLSALAAQLGVEPSVVAGDLSILSFCGVAPYDPFGLVPVLVDGDEVEVFGEIPAVKGPVRLSAGEAEALAAALQAAGFGAEDRLTAKLLAATTEAYDAAEVERVVRASISGHDIGVYEQLARSTTEREAVEIEHAPADGGVASCRTVEPTALFAERGAWYLSAWCRTADDWRTFRLDRIRSVHATGEHFDLAARPIPPTELQALDIAGLPNARVRFAPGEQFSEREWPGAVVADQQADGATLVDVPYAGTAWIARHIVARLGAVSVLEPTEVREAVRRLAAEELDRLG